MTDYSEVVRKMRTCIGDKKCFEKECRYWSELGCMDGNICCDAADAIEALQAEVQFYNALADEWQSSAENKERLLGLYRAELYRDEKRNVYSAIDNNGRIISNPCACMNIPVFPDCSESPNS